MQVRSTRFGAYDPLTPPALPGAFAAIVQAPPVPIPAPAEVVWAVLTDLAAYPQWCPFTRRVEGALALGAQVALHVHWGPHAPLAAEGAAHRVQRAEVTVLEAPWAVGWSASMAGLRNERLQLLEPHGDGVRYHTHDRFAGPLAPAVMGLYRGRILAGLRAVGEALARRVARGA